ncbi:MAG: hypothetical protein CNLJKLNK_00894 [Holosporales bacterium]
MMKENVSGAERGEAPKAKRSAKTSSSAQKSKRPIPDFFAHAKKVQEDVKKFTPFNKDPQEMFKEMPKMSTEDREKILHLHRKNMETLNEANKMAVDVMRQITQMQGQFMRQTFEEIDEVIRENLAYKNVTPQEQMAKNTQRVQNAVQRAVEHSGNMSQIMLKSNQELFKNVQNQFEEGMKEMQAMMNKTKH